MPNSDKELEKAREAFANQLKNAPPNKGKGYEDEMGMVQDLLGSMGMNVNPKQIELMQLVSQVDFGWMAGLLGHRPDWEMPHYYFHTAVHDFAKMIILQFLQAEAMEPKVPFQRLLFVTDQNPGSAEHASRLKVDEAAKKQNKNDTLKERIPFVLGLGGKPMVGDDGKPQRIKPDAMILAQCTDGEVKNGLPSFKVSATLLTYAFMGSASVDVDINKGIFVNHNVFIRPCDDIAEWEEVITFKDCSA